MYFIINPYFVKTIYFSQKHVQEMIRCLILLDVHRVLFKMEATNYQSITSAVPEAVKIISSENNSYYKVSNFLRKGL